MTGGQDQTVGFWQLNGNTIEALRVGKGHERSVESLAARKDQRKFASGGFDGLLKLWNFDAEIAEKKQKSESGAPVVTPMVTLDGHKESVSGLSWVREAEELTSVSFDHTIRIWDLTMPGMKHQMVSLEVQFMKFRFNQCGEGWVEVSG